MKGVVLLAAGMLATIAFVALSPAVFEDWRMRALTIVAALAGIVWLYRLDSGREAEEKKLQTEIQEKRLRELRACAAAPQFELNVSGSSQIFVGVSAAFIGAALLFESASGRIGWALGGAAAIAMGLLSLMGTVPTLGKPKISITKLGFKTPLTPFVPWKVVEGMDLEKVTQRETLIAHVLQFFIPSLPLEISRYGWSLRLLNWLRTRTGKQRLRVVLKNSSEHPDVLYRLIRELWTADTGRTHLWMPSMSEAYNAALRRMEEAEARLYREALAGPPLRRPGDARDIGREFSEAYAVVTAETRRRAQMLRWLIAAGIVVVIVCIFIS